MPRFRDHEIEAAVRDELDTLRHDLRDLRADVSRLVNAVVREGSDSVRTLGERVSETAHSARTEIDETARKVARAGRRSYDAVEGQVREHPFATGLAMFGIGVLAVTLIGWARQEPSQPRPGIE